jgi:hypothetical protein
MEHPCLALRRRAKANTEEAVDGAVDLGFAASRILCDLDKEIREVERLPQGLATEDVLLLVTLDEGSDVFATHALIPQVLLALRARAINAKQDESLFVGPP